MAWLIVTDLDGTLLDDRYPERDAAAALDAVAGLAGDVRIALASSKTPDEMISLASRCRQDPVLLFENGAGIAWREPVLLGRGSRQHADYEIEFFGSGYAHICAALDTLRRRKGYDFRGFADMSDAEVAVRTGLDERTATMARQRVASEPVLWRDSPDALADFRAELTELGLSLERGGRFLHVTARASKARAVKHVKRLIRYQRGAHVTTLVCGDAPNDLQMLRDADFAIVFPSPDRSYLLPENDRVRHAHVAGPEAWLASVSDCLAANSRTALAS